MKPNVKRACAVFLFWAGMAIPSHAQTFTTILSFDGTNGSYPEATLVQGTDGNFYGTSAAGGKTQYCRNCGTFFKIAAAGVLTTIYNSCAQADCADGSAPDGGLLLAPDGAFYGATAGGGTFHGGAVFRITSDGTYTTLHSLTSAEGTGPTATLAESTDGYFYDTTFEGGANNRGSVFKVAPTGTLTNIYSFCLNGDCGSGSNPMAGLVEGADGNLYGTTPGFLTTNPGTVFTITPNGVLRTLHTFCSRSNCADGMNPSASLIQGTDGAFYGTTLQGGANGGGTVFKITGSGALTRLHSFCNEMKCAGAGPQSALIQATDGNFYGTTLYGGPRNYGTVFRTTPQGKTTILYIFCSQLACVDGETPFGGLLQATDGKLYGTTTRGGTGRSCQFRCGTVFSLDVGLGPFVSLVHYWGRIASPIGILGQGFTGTTEVSVNGTAASFTVVSDTYLTAKVPSGATTGFVTVTTPTGTLTSNKALVVKP
jgi:uncharacterized repeat protein (TIGR03803 family)